MESIMTNPTAGDCLGYFANKLNVDSDSLVKKIYANALLDKDSLAASHLTSVVMDAMKSEMDKYARNTLRTMTVPQTLKPDEQEALKSMYPEYNLNFSNNTYESHNFAHASRTLETIMCMNKLSYFINYKIRKREIILKDIGGNRVFHALRGHTSVHVCAPILSHVDAHRKATNDWRINNMVALKSDFYRYNAAELLKRTGPNYCTNMGQNCAVRSPALMFIHSIYDMTPTDVADSMTAADATIAAGTFIYDPRILMYDMGKLPLLNVTWRKYVRDNIKYIDFTFIGDAQPVYTHSLSVYLSYLETTYIVDTTKKNFYTFQFNENRYGIQFFSLIRIDYPYVPQSNIKINHTLLGQDNFLLVTYYEWVEKVAICGKGRMRKLKLLVPTSLWEQAYDMLKQQSDGSFTIAKATEFMICYNKKTIVNGQTVSHHQKCSSQVLDKLAYALYVRVYIDKYLASSALTMILDDVNNVRELTKMGPLKAMYTIMKDKIRNFFFPTIETETTLAPYCAWATMSKLYKFPVDIRDAITFKSVDTIVPEIVQLHRKNKDFGEICDYMAEEEIDISPIIVDSNMETPPDECKPDFAAAQLFAGPMGCSPTSCSRMDGTVVQVPGDGHCFFHATILHMIECDAAPTTPDDMRRLVAAALRTHSAFSAIDAAIKADLCHQLTGGTGAEPVCILVCKATAIVYKFNLCVHVHKNDIFDHTELYNINSGYTTYHYHFNSYGNSNVGHFQAITFDKTYAPCTTVTCDSDMQIIDRIDVIETDEIITQLGMLEQTCVMDAKDRMQDRNIVHKYVSNDVLPIIALVDRMSYNINGENVLDLCSAPGGVSQYLIESGAQHVVAVTDKADSQVFFDANIAQNYFDMTDVPIVLEFVKVHSSMQFGLVVADGCGCRSGYDNNRNLMLCELIVALSLLEDTGNMIIRSWRYKYSEQNTILEILRLRFADVQIVRPYPLHPTDDTNYIVCTNYDKPKNRGFVSTFINMILGSVINSDSIIDIVIDDIISFRNSLDTLMNFVANPGFNTNVMAEKENFLNLLPVVDIDNDSCGGLLPEMRPVKLSFVSLLLQSFLCSIDNITYPYVNQSEILSKCGISTDASKILQNGIAFATELTIYCKNLTVTDIVKLKITSRMRYGMYAKHMQFTCESCNEIQCIPRINGFYACVCDARDMIYVYADNVMMCQRIAKRTCDAMIKRGAIINATMSSDDASYEYDVYIDNATKVCDYGKLRHQITKTYNLIAKDFEKKISIEMKDMVNCQKEMPESNDNNVTQENDKTIGDAMYDTVALDVTNPKVDEDRMTDNGTTNVRLKKAFHECYNIWKLTDYNHTVTLKKLLHMTVETKPSKELTMYLNNQDTEPYVRVAGVWYPTSPKKNYMYEYDGEKYRPFDLYGSYNAIVSEYTEKKFEPTFMEKCSAYYKNVYDHAIDTKFELVSGVPGCGKTTYIMENHKIGDLVLSATKEGAREFRKRAYDNGEPDVQRNYRTVYSYLYNTHDRYETVYVDEAMMMHPGMMYAIMCGTRCKRLVMVGDVRQIPYYVRIDYDASYHKFDSVFKVTSYLNVSYRCPQDVAKLMRNYYDKFESASKVVKSLNVQYVSGKNDVPTGFDVYLTFSQSDKELLLTMYDNVNTIHEYQGKQAKRVALFRGSPTMLKLYDSVEHHIVALTRHTNSLTYFTVLQDGLYGAIARMKGGGIDHQVEYVTSSVFASNKYAMFHFTSKDMQFKTGIDVDIGNRIKAYRTETVSSQLGGLKYTYDTNNKRYILHLITHKKYYQTPEYKYIKSSLYLMKNFLRNHTIFSIHTAINYNGNWYDIEQLLSALECVVVVHDPKGKYDRYRLSDVILEYHHEQKGPNQVYHHEKRIRDVETRSLRIAHMPNVYVLVYTDVVIADVDMQKKFHYVPIIDYNPSCRRMHRNRIYENYCILLDKDTLRTVGHQYNIKKYFSKALMKRSFRNSINTLDILQQFNDMVLPNAFGVDTSFDVRLVALSDVSYHVQNCSFNASMIHNPVRVFDCITPRLKTAICPPRPTNSLKEVLKAVEKRNCAVPRIQLSMNVYNKAIELYRKFIKYMCVDDVVSDEINYSKDMVEDWLTTQDNNIVNMIQKESISDIALNKYSLTIKKNSKPIMDLSCINTYAALQTVVFSSKDFNTYFCPIFRKFKSNMMEKLVDKVLLMADMPPSKFAELMNKQLSTARLDTMYSLEFDVSKYDKSQALLHLLVDCFILKHFGLSDIDVNRWFVGHVFTVLRDPSTRLTAYNYFQRKSGDPSTWILNTVQILVMIVNVLDMSQWDSVLLILASGDDSEIISTDKLRINQKRFADVFNYEVKIYDKYRSIYFCSKFIVFDTAGDVYIIPDLFKMIKKLGRHDLKNKEHLVSYRKSVLDGLKDFIVPDRVKIEYVTALSERYNCEAFSYESLINALYNATIDDESFERLYDKNSNYYSVGFGTASDI